ncbi:MAG: HDOD domain-containing protein [Gammaproteobacteria bacterium]|nr:HDOD domain-containing protein [Gammaproteobacteria bacterium]
MENTAKQYPDDLESWADELMTVRMPVFSSTKKALQNLNEDDANRSVDRFCLELLFDPGSVLAILSRANKRKNSIGTKVGTVENAAMMIGINSMKALLNDSDIIDPPGETVSEKGFMSTVARSYHTAYQAYDWAVQRGDMMPKEIFVAAFLYDIGAMMMWLYCPEKMMETHDLKWGSQVPDAEAQYVIFGFSMEQLSRVLAERLNLPEMVTDSLNAEDARNPRALSIRLANKLVHLSETGWYTEDITECLESIASLLDEPYDNTVKRAHRNAIEVARETEMFEVKPSASLLPMTSCEWPRIHDDDENENEEEDGQHFCLMPQSYLYDASVGMLQMFAKSDDIAIFDIMENAMVGLHDGLGLNRVVFALLSKDKTKLQGKYIRGAESDPAFSQFGVEVDLGRKDLFTQLLQKPRSVWMSRENSEKIWPLIPEKFKEIVGTNEFYAMSVFVKKSPIGIFYADRHLKDSHLEEKSYGRFKTICSLVSKAIEASSKK